MNVTLFPQLTDAKNCKLFDLADILAAIRSPSVKVATICSALRSEPDKNKRRIMKAALPAICFGAAIGTRESTVDGSARESGRSGIVCLDFDAVPEVQAVKARLATDPHVLSVFLSPSGDGLKVLVPIATTWEAHWRALSTYLLGRYGIAADEARKDVHGLCFASHDPEIWIAPDLDAVEPFREVMDETPERFTSPRLSTFARDGEVLSDFADPLVCREPLSHISPDLEYPQWIEIGQALHCQFGGGNDGLDLWNTWSAGGAKYSGEKDVYSHYRSFKASGITFRTVLRQAISAGWRMPRKTTSTARAVIAPAPVIKSDPLRELIEAEADGTFRLTPWPWKLLTQRSRSLLPGSVTVLCGAPGSAKSWFGLSCLRFWSERNIPAAVLMLEENKAWHLNRLLTQLEGNKDFLDSDKVRENPDDKREALARHATAIDRVGEALWVENNITVSACADWVEKRCAEGVRVLIVDPITLADTGAEKPWESDRRFMARCQAAIVKAGASLILVTHPRKTTGPSAAAPSMDDMAGGAAFSRAAGSVLWLGNSNNQREWIESSDGAYLADAHKQIRILKARNGIGSGDVIISTFDRFILNEVGVLGKEPDGGEAGSTERSSRKKRSASKPSASEETF